MSRKRLIHAMSGTFGIKIFTLFINFITAIVLTNALGAEAFGLYTLGVTLAVLLVIFGKLGADLNAVRYSAVYVASNRWGELKGFLRWQRRSVIIASFSITFLAYILIRVFFEWNDDSITYKTYAYSILLVPVLSFIKTNSALLRGLGSVYKAQVGEATKSFLLLILLLVAFRYLNVAPYDVILISMASSLCSLLIVLHLLNKLIPSRTNNAIPQYNIKPWWKSSLIFTFTSGFNVINRRIDIVLIGIILGVYEAGIYAVSKRSLDLIIPVFASANHVLGPQVADLYSKNRLQQIELIGMSISRLLTFIVSLIFIILIIFGKDFLSIFGNEFIVGYWVMLILVSGQIANAMFGSVGMILNMSGHEQYTAKAGIILCSVNILSNILLIPIFGLIGAAVSSTISLIIWNLTLHYALRKELHIQPSFARLNLCE